MGVPAALTTGVPAPAALTTGAPAALTTGAPVTPSDSESDQEWEDFFRVVPARFESEFRILPTQEDVKRRGFKRFIDDGNKIWLVPYLDYVGGCRNAKTLFEKHFQELMNAKKDFTTLQAEIVAIEDGYRVRAQLRLNDKRLMVELQPLIFPPVRFQACDVPRVPAYCTRVDEEHGKFPDTYVAKVTILPKVHIAGTKINNVGEEILELWHKTSESPESIRNKIAQRADVFHVEFDDNGFHIAMRFEICCDGVALVHPFECEPTAADLDHIHLIEEARSDGRVTVRRKIALNYFVHDVLQFVDKQPLGSIVIPSDSYILHVQSINVVPPLDVRFTQGGAILPPGWHVYKKQGRNVWLLPDVYIDGTLSRKYDEHIFEQLCRGVPYAKVVVPIVSKSVTRGDGIRVISETLCIEICPSLETNPKKLLKKYDSQGPGVGTKAIGHLKELARAHNKEMFCSLADLYALAEQLDSFSVEDFQAFYDNEYALKLHFHKNGNRIIVGNWKYCNCKGNLKNRGVFSFNGTNDVELKKCRKGDQCGSIKPLRCDLCKKVSLALNSGLCSHCVHETFFCIRCNCEKPFVHTCPSDELVRVTKRGRYLLTLAKTQLSGGVCRYYCPTDAAHLKASKRHTETEWGTYDGKPVYRWVGTKGKAGDKFGGVMHKCQWCDYKCLSDDGMFDHFVKHHTCLIFICKTCKRTHSQGHEARTCCAERREKKETQVVKKRRLGAGLAVFQDMGVC